MTPSKRRPASRNHIPIVSPATRGKVQGAVQFAVSRGITGANEEIFRLFGVKHATGYNILKGSPYTGQNNVKKRGRPCKMTPAQVVEADQLLEDSELDMEAKGMTWIGIKWELNLDVCPHTIQRTLRSAKDWSKYDAAVKPALSERTKQSRLN